MKRDQAGFLFAFAFLFIYCFIKLCSHYNRPLWAYSLETGPLPPVLTLAETAPEEVELSAYSKELCRRTAIGAAQLLYVRENWLDEIP